MAKGLGMLLIILAHAPLAEKLSRYIYSFHVPLFFLLSGYLYRDVGNATLLQFLKNKFGKLGIPYLWFALINFIILYIFQALSDEATLSIPKSFVGTFLGLRSLNWSPHLGPLWFIPCLFLTELVIFLISRNSSLHSKKTAVIVFIISVLGIIYNKTIHIPLAYSLDAVPFALVFFYGGCLFAKFEHRFWEYLDTPVAFVGLGILSLALGIFNKTVNIFWSMYGNPAIYFIAAFLGIYLVIYVARSLPEVRFLEYIGKNAIVFLALHQIFLFGIFSAVVQRAGLPQDGNIERTLTGIVYTVSAVGLLIPINELIKHYMPFLLGTRYLPRPITQVNR